MPRKQVNKGGKAFPVSPDEKGMTLRDYFAAHALSAIYVDPLHPETAASDAYAIADAMVAEHDTSGRGGVLADNKA